MDSNILTLDKNGSSGNKIDDFNYVYYTRTNRLQRVFGASGNQFSYDANGNLILDALNNNNEMLYDHRNLITQFYHTDREAVSRPYTYATRYYYDESGSRVRKLEYFNTQTNPPLITDWDNPGNGWTLSNNEFYVKGADGKDLATYQGSELEDWYVWGNDLAGKIRKDKPYFYFKDHLGSVRAIVNENAQIVAAFDYDAWGYPLEGREYNADSMKFKYTGKELDKESLYDYFGARYYDGRFGRWGSVDPLMNKYLSNSPYNFTLNNPIIFLDKNGDDPYRDHLGSLNDVVNILNQNIGKSFWEVKNAFSTSTARYVYTQVEGFFDLQHFFASGYLSAFVGVSNTLEIGESIENFQDKGVWTFDENSGWDPEDPMSNLWGAIFGVSADNPLSLSQEDIQKFVELMLELGIVDKNDPSIAKDKLYIPQNDKDISLPQRKEFYYTPYRGESVNYPIPFRYLKMFGKEGRIP